MALTAAAGIGWLLLLIVVQLALAPKPSRAAVDEYEYEQKDQAAELKKSIQRLERDKHKVALAIETTKTLIDRSRQRPYLPELYLRLAELYIEKSRVVYLLRKSRQTDAAAALKQLESNTLKKQAVELYQRILDHFPDFADRDKVYFFMAHEYGELGQLEDMVKQYRSLIAAHKNSQYVPEAYLLLGDYFFSKQNLALAQKHYQAVLDFPDSSASIIARYKLGWCYVNTADYKQALKLFEASVTTSKGDKEVDIDTYRHVNVRLEALIDMAFCYPEVYRKSSPEKAMAYFQQFAWSRQSYTTVLEKLAGRYFVKKKWHQAGALYRQLAELRYDPQRLMEYAGNIYECVQAMGAYKDIDQDVQLVVKALEQQKYSVHVGDDEKEKNMAEFELYARDVITHLHDGARQKKHLKDFEQAAAAYTLYLDFFKQSPVRTEMQANYAEALFASKQYLEAGKQYEKLTEHDAGQSVKNEDRLYSTVIAYYQAIKDKDQLNYYQLAWARKGLQSAGKQYVAAFPATKRTADVRYNIAWIAYDAGKLDEAIAEFSRFIETYPHGRTARAAAHLILDAYYQKEDFDGLAEFGRRIMKNGRIKDPKFKQEVAKIVQGAESKIVSSLTVSAVDDYDKGRSGLIELVNKGGASAGVSEQALSALIVASQDKNDLDTLFTAGTSLVSQFPKSTQVENTLNLMIDTSLQANQYRLLAEYLESFCRILPKHDNAPEFLYQAGQIRQALGQFRQANSNYRKLLKRRPRSAKMRAEVIFAMAENAGRSGQWKTAVRTLDANYKVLSRTARIRALAQIADLTLQNGKPRAAGQYRSRALKSYRRQQTANDVLLQDTMARMDYNHLDSARRRYLKLQLRQRLDDKIVTAKKEQLANLEKNYQQVLKYQSPLWALRACYRLAEINREFARFLQESPLPDLGAEQKKQYIRLLGQKAQQYVDKADQYYQSGLKLARKRETCDPALSGYLSANGAGPDPDDSVKSFAGTSRNAAVAAESLKDASLLALYAQLIRQPDNLQPFLLLANSYLQKGDFRQAALVAQNALNKANRGQTDVVSQIHNTLGVSWLYLGEDELARDAFKRAIEKNSANAAARINLAGLYQHYGHAQRAGQIYAKVTAAPKKGLVNGQIHPRAGDMFYENRKISKN